MTIRPDEIHIDDPHLSADQHEVMVRLSDFCRGLRAEQDKHRLRYGLRRMLEHQELGVRKFAASLMVHWLAPDEPEPHTDFAQLIHLYEPMPEPTRRKRWPALLAIAALAALILWSIFKLP